MAGIRNKPAGRVPGLFGPLQLGSDSVEEVAELRVPPGNRLERLAGRRKGQYSIRINGQFRICFVWSDDGPLGVEIVDYH